MLAPSLNPLLLAGEVADAQTVESISVTCTAEGNLKTVAIAGHVVRNPLGPKGEVEIKPLLPNPRTPLVINNSIETPYKCLGALIYSLQRWSYRKIAFISEPAPAAAYR